MARVPFEGFSSMLKPFNDARRRRRRPSSGTRLAGARRGNHRMSVEELILAAPTRGRQQRATQVGERLGRSLDIVVAVLALAFFSIILLLIAALIAAERRGPIFFAHARIGLNNRTIKVFKFRTMLPNSDELLREHLSSNPEAAAEWARDFKLRRDPRVTLLGDFLRKSSLDEVPQFFNVLRGEMSVVGPRPIVAAEKTRYGRAIKSYLSVRPGITGLWQVSGRNNVSYRRRVAMDVYYARRKSILLDLSIILRTIPAVLLRKGSY